MMMGASANDAPAAITEQAATNHTKKDFMKFSNREIAKDYVSLSRQSLCLVAT
jgi:hypothetical protein